MNAPIWIFIVCVLCLFRTMPTSNLGCTFICYVQRWDMRVPQ